MNDHDTSKAKAPEALSEDALNDVQGAAKGQMSFMTTQPTTHTGVDTFTYTISDGNGGYDDATVVKPGNRNPGKR